MKERIIVVKVGNDDYPTNCYIVVDKNNEALVIDPGLDSEKIINKIKEENAKVSKIILTHCHADHVGALDDIKEYTNAKVYIHENDIDGIEDEEKPYFEYLGIKRQNITSKDMNVIVDGQNIKNGELDFEIIHTPGHTNGSICIYVEKLNALFTGDTIFHNCYGRCDLKSGNISEMGKSIEKIFNRFESVNIYPGHEHAPINIDGIKRKIRLLYRIKNNN